MSNESGSRFLLVVDVLLIIVIIIIGICAYQYSEKKDDVTLSISQLNSKENIPIWRIHYNFTSDVFSAQNEIHVEAILEIDKNYTKTHKQIVADTEFFYVYLPNSFSRNATYERGQLVPSPITLEKESEGVFHGEGYVTYPDEGSKCAFVSSTFKEYVYCDGDPVIQISSMDSLLQMQNNKSTMSLTLIFFALTMITLRVFVADMLQNILKFKKYKDDGTDTKESSNPQKDTTQSNIISENKEQTEQNQEKS